METPSIPAAPPPSTSQQRQLADIRVYALTLLDLMQGVSLDETLQAEWSEHIDAHVDLVQLLDLRLQGSLAGDDLVFAKRLKDFGVLLRDRRDRAKFTPGEAGPDSRALRLDDKIR